MAIEFQLHLPFQTMTTQIPIYKKKTASEPLLGLLRILYALVFLGKWPIIRKGYLLGF